MKINAVQSILSISASIVFLRTAPLAPSLSPIILSKASPAVVVALAPVKLIENADKEKLSLSSSWKLLETARGGISHSSVLLSKNTNNAQTLLDNEFVRGLVSGAVSRASKEILLHPFDTIRARQQMKSKKISSLDINTNTSSKLFSNLYAGLVPALLGGIPAGGVFFAVKDSVKASLKTWQFSASYHSLVIDMPAVSLSREEITIISVIVANVFYWLIRSPAEELKTKQQVATAVLVKEKSEDMGEEIGTFEGLKTLFGSVGIRGALNRIYGSYNSNLIYALPADIIKFLAYEYFSSTFFHAGTGKITGVDAAISGAMSGLVAQTITTPLDLARTRIMSKLKTIQKQDLESQTTNNPLDIMIATAKNEGIGSLWKGVIPRAARALGSGAIQFASYELTQNAMTG